MDLLGKETQQKDNNKAKRTVLMLLIVSIVLLVLVVIMIFALQGNKTRPLTLSINDVDTKIAENLMISGEDEKTYISLQLLSSSIGYECLGGGYLEYNDTDKTKCYLENTNQIIGFEADSKEIYKTSVNSTTDYQYYELNNIIMQQNDMLYIALEDLNVGCNVVYSFSEQENKINIYTIENLSTQYTTSFEEEGSNIVAKLESFNNQKALCYDMIVIANQNGKMGVINSSNQTIIGNRYTTMEFDEETQSFIVSDDNNKFGVISANGEPIIGLEFEELSIINYSPLLYQIKLNGKYGVLNEEGEVLINPEFDRLGYTESSSSTNESVLIINNLSNGNQSGIVVSKEGKYGIANISTGEMIINCNVDKIYSRRDSSNNKKYYIELQSTEIDLDKYIEYVSSTTVNLNQ